VAASQRGQGDGGAGSVQNMLEEEGGYPTMLAMCVIWSPLPNTAAAN
jgi:hypothetical protein